MADIFHHDDVRSLLNGKYVLFFGGSNVRALYKDLVVLLVSNRLISDSELTKKLEPSFLGDSLLHAIGLTRGRDFKEHRIFTLDDTIAEYFFITKCLCPDVCNTLKEIRSGERRTPDLVVMNSTLWDISRWGSQSVKLFKENLQKLAVELKRCLPPTTLVVWLTVPPVSQDHRGVLIPEVEFLKHTMRFDSMEANIFAHKILTANGFDVLDFHYYMKLNVHRRWKDGVHWVSAAVRYMTNLLLTHISLAWGCDALPGKEGRQEIQLEKLQETIEERCNLTAVQNSVKPMKKNSSCVKNKTAHEKKCDSINTKKEEESKENDCHSDSGRSRKMEAVYYGSSVASRFHRRPSSKKLNNNRNEYRPCGERRYQSHDGDSDDECYDDDYYRAHSHFSTGSEYVYNRKQSESCGFNSNLYHNNDEYNAFKSRSHKPYRHKDNYNHRSRPMKRLQNSGKHSKEHFRRTGFDTKYRGSEKSLYRGQRKERPRRSENGFVGHRSSRNVHVPVLPKSRPRRTNTYRSYR